MMLQKTGRRLPPLYPKTLQVTPGLHRCLFRFRLTFAASLLIFATLSTFLYDIDKIRRLTAYYTPSYSFPPPASEKPPDYSELRRWEANLPQHNPDLPFPEGSSGRYVLFSNSRINPSGWNNKLNDMLMNTWLAHASNRAYVFHDFTWVDSHYPWTVSIYREWTPRTPINALLSGPSAGGPWDLGDAAPRSVSERFFDAICPKNVRKIINTRDVKPALREADGQAIFRRWETILTEAAERCVEIVASKDEDLFPETFDIFYWSGIRSVSIWDEFIQSPVSRLLRASPIVLSAIQDNLPLFRVDPSLATSVTNIREPQPSIERRISETFSTIFSIHVRRGDFQEACVEHAQSNSTFYNWNLLPFLPDKFNALPEHSDNRQHILKRCWPTAETIRAKVNLARQEYEDSLPQGPRGPTLLYIMSNDRTDWIKHLKEVFERDGWSKVVMSRDLVLGPQQRDVSVAVDMEIGRRSEVFIGNGWSSFTSNVVHQRLADKKAPISIRFW